MASIAIYTNGILFLIIGGIHLYWVFGGKWGLATAIPVTQEGLTILQPGKVITLLVALGLFLFALISFSNMIEEKTSFIYYMNWFIAVVFFMRFLGDFKYLGITRRINNSPFAKMDARVFTPLCLLLFINGLIIITA